MGALALSSITYRTPAACMPAHLWLWRSEALTGWPLAVALGWVAAVCTAAYESQHLAVLQAVVSSPVAVAGLKGLSEWPLAVGVAAPSAATLARCWRTSSDAALIRRVWEAIRRARGGSGYFWASLRHSHTACVTDSEHDALKLELL